MSAERVIAIAQSQIGYLEKATNSNLDSMTGNSGYNNYTKYARDLAAAGYYNGNKNGFAWCDVFVDWCFYQAYGSKAAAEKVECQTGTLGAGCYYSMQYYINAGRFSTTPKVGDQIFFKDSSGDICHTGLVYALSDSTVYTIEGNTSSASGVVANGGGVARKSYARTYGRIAGYGHPRYDAAETVETPTATTSKTVYFWPYRKYKNGSTPEAVYEDSDLTKQYGSLNAGESCYCMARHNGAYAVVYGVDGHPGRYKMGWVRYSGGGHPRYDASEATGSSTATTSGTQYFFPYRKYQNGSTPEAVFEDSDLVKQYGSLNAGESCYCMARHNGAYAVVYGVDGHPGRYKMGWVRYSGGVS